MRIFQQLVVLLLCLSAVVLTACVEQTKTVSQQDELSRLSAVAVVSPGFGLERGATLGWRSDVFWLRSDSIAETTGSIINRSRIRVTIEEQLRDSGHRFVNAGESPDYVLIAAVLLGDSEKGQAVEELAKLYPSLEYVSDTLEKGTLMVGLSRPGSPVILWRAGIQAFIADEATAEQRQQRLHAVVRSLFRTLPMKESSL